MWLAIRKPADGMRIEQEREKHAKRDLVPAASEALLSRPFRARIGEARVMPSSGCFTTGSFLSSLRLASRKASVANHLVAGLAAF
jgi:hypothetical protein